MQNYTPVSVFPTVTFDKFSAQSSFINSVDAPMSMYPGGTYGHKARIFSATSYTYGIVSINPTAVDDNRIVDPGLTLVVTPAATSYFRLKYNIIAAGDTHYTYFYIMVNGNPFHYTAVVGGYYDAAINSPSGPGVPTLYLMDGNFAPQAYYVDGELHSTCIEQVIQLTGAQTYTIELSIGSGLGGSGKLISYGGSVELT